MNKKITILLIAVVTALTLTACGKFTCDLCGREQSGKNYKTEVMREKVVICKDCYSDIKELRDAFGNY